MRRIGAIFTPYSPPEALRDAASAADESGLEELWLWEDCFRESAFATASAVLAWTGSLRVGLAVAPVPLRNVALMAMETATLDRLFPGRFVPGVGHGVLDWMGQIGARVASPLTLLREYVVALRALLEGEEVTTSGRYVSLDRVRLDWPPSVCPPLLVAGEGPRTVRLTGEVGDGTILPARSDPDRVARTLAIALEGRAEAGRDDRHQMLVFVETGDRVHPGDIAEFVEPYFAAGATSALLQPRRDEPDLPGYMARASEVARLVGARA